MYINKYPLDRTENYTKSYGSQFSPQAKCGQFSSFCMTFFPLVGFQSSLICQFREQQTSPSSIFSTIHPLSRCLWCLREQVHPCGQVHTVNQICGHLPISALNSSKKSNTAKGKHRLSQTCFTTAFSMCVCLSHSVVSDSLQPYGLQPAGFLCPWNPPGKNTAVGSHSSLYGIFLAQGLNLGCQHCRCILYHLSHQGSLHLVSPQPQSCYPDNYSLKHIWKMVREVCVHIAQSIMQGQGPRKVTSLACVSMWTALHQKYYLQIKANIS